MGDWDDLQLLAQLSQMFHTLTDTFTNQVDMHRGQSMLLCTVCLQKGMTQSEIAEQLGVQGATVTNMVQRMEEAGLVVRRRDPEDNRLVRVYPTEEGLRKEAQINEQFKDMQAVMFKGLTDDERAALRRLIVQILSNMNK